MKIKDFQYKLTIQTFDDTGKSRVIPQIFKHDKQKVLDLEKDGSGIFWCINPQRDLSNRSVENTTELRVVGLDCDIAKEKDSKSVDKKILKQDLLVRLVELPLPPSGIIETKNGLQPYWYFNPSRQLKDKNMANEDYQLLIKSFTKHTGIKSEGDNLCRVLRLPRTYHQKNPKDKFKIKEVYPKGQPTTLEKFIKTYPLIKKGETNTQSTTTQNFEEIASIYGWGTLRGLTESESRYWQGKSYAGRDDLMKSIALSVLNFEKKYNYDPLEVCLYLNALMADPLSEKIVEEKLKSARKAPPKRKLKTRLTDTSNAEFICKLYGDKVRYDHKRGRWLIWGKHRWEPDLDNSVRRLAILAPRERHKMAQEIKNYKKRQVIYKWANSSESRMRIEAAISITKSLKPIADNGRNWDEDKFLLSCPNGIVDLKTGKLRNGVPEDRITMSTNTEYDPQAECPRWEQFVNEIFKNDQVLIEYVHKALGYSITGDTSEQVAFFCFGKGANGKSVLFKTIRKILGDYGHDAPTSLLQRSYGNAIPNDVAATELKRFLVSAETLSTSKLNEQRLKAWTGGDRVSARFLNKEFFEFEPTVKPWLFINHKPKVEDDSLGFWRRVRLIPFNRKFMGKDDDKKLPDKLMKEFTGVLAWLVRGCSKWQQEGLDPTPDTVSEATKTYQTENDDLYDFLVDEYGDRENVEVKAAEFYKKYDGWVENQGFKQKDILSRTAFGRRMSDKFDKVKRNDGIYYLGVGLNPNSEASVEFDPQFPITPHTRESIERTKKKTSNYAPEAKKAENYTPEDKTTAEKALEEKKQKNMQGEIVYE